MIGKKSVMRKVCLILGAVVALTGCASYQSSPLAALDPKYIKQCEQVKGLSIGAKAYDETDCYIFLDRDVIEKGYQPIQLTFQNTTDRHYLFSTNEVSLPCVNFEEVAKTVHTSTLGRAAGYSAGGLIFLKLLWPLFIPAVVDGIKSSNANQALDRDYYDKAKEHLVITPNSFVKTLIFVPRSHFAPVFDITLLEEETRETKKISLSVAQ